MKEKELVMLQVENDSSKESFTDAIGKEDESDSDEHSGREHENKAKVTTETLTTFPAAPGANR